MAWEKVKTFFNKEARESRGMETVFVDEDGVRVRNKAGKEITFGLDPTRFLDAWREQMMDPTRPLPPIEHLHMRHVFPHAVESPKPPEGSNTATFNPDLPNFPVDPYGVRLKEYLRMQNFARRQLYERYRKRWREKKS